MKREQFDPGDWAEDVAWYLVDKWDHLPGYSKIRDDHPERSFSWAKAMAVADLIRYAYKRWGTKR